MMLTGILKKRKDFFFLPLQQGKGVLMIVSLTWAPNPFDPTRLLTCSFSMRVLGFSRGCSWPQQRPQKRREPCREVTQGQRKCSPHNERMEFQAQVLSSEPPWLAHDLFCVLWHFFFFWYLWLPTFLFCFAHLPWCISHLKGKTICNPRRTHS